MLGQDGEHDRANATEMHRVASSCQLADFMGGGGDDGVRHLLDHVPHGGEECSPCGECRSLCSRGGRASCDRCCNVRASGNHDREGVHPVLQAAEPCYEGCSGGCSHLCGSGVTSQYADGRYQPCRQAAASYQVREVDHRGVS